MYITQIHIKNIRCFSDLKIKFDFRGVDVPWTMIVGDNATGKTALLKSIALGLCDESSAAALLRESDEGYIRRGCNYGRIVIYLKDPNNSVGEKYRIETKIEKVPISNGDSDKSYERVKQKVFPKYQSFPWGKIFACAYGAARGIIGSGDIAGYSVINAVYNMFNYGEGLQNPELMIRRILIHPKNKARKTQVLKVLSKILYSHLQDGNKYKIDLSPTGVTVDGPWGEKMPLRDLADGYKSTFLWIADFLGWALSYYSEIKSFKEISGIVLIDEIEQHLHPKWKRNITYYLRKEFPKIQFITTTHSPLVASSVGQLTVDSNHDKLINLALFEDNNVIKYEAESLRGQDIDRVLASKVFDYTTSADPGVERLLAEASELASKGRSRTPDENRRYIEFKEAIKKIIQPAGPLVEVKAKEEIYNEMKKQIKKLEKKLLKND